MNKDQPSPVDRPTISVITAAFAMERWDGLCQAVASIAAQTVTVMETIAVIDHNPDLLDRARRELPGVVVVPNLRDRGASGARNSGVAASHGDVVAFLDDDAVASPSWLEVMLPHFADPGVVGVGCRVVPVWAGSRPRWFPPEFDWAVGGSYRGMPESAAPVRNVWTCGMAVSRSVFEAIGGFRDDFGKVGGRSRPEDTDLSLRAAAARPGGTWVYDPAAAVSHHVPLERATFGFFLRRCLNEGSGKAALAALNGGSQSTSAERLYTRRVLPAGVARGLRDTVRGDVWGGLRSAAIAAGLSSATAGFAAGRVAGMVRRADLPQPQGGNGTVRHPASTRAPRILVDQSGYDLLNVGDVAMVQSCVIRLRRLWPDADIMVICHAPERLASYCPGTTAIGQTLVGLPFFRILPRRPRLAAEQAWKMAAPYFSCRFHPGGSGGRLPKGGPGMGPPGRSTADSRAARPAAYGDPGRARGGPCRSQRRRVRDRYVVVARGRRAEPAAPRPAPRQADGHVRPGRRTDQRPPRRVACPARAGPGRAAQACRSRLAGRPDRQGPGDIPGHPAQCDGRHRR